MEGGFDFDRPIRCKNDPGDVENEGKVAGVRKADAEIAGYRMVGQFLDHFIVRTEQLERDKGIIHSALDAR